MNLFTDTDRGDHNVCSNHGYITVLTIVLYSHSSNFLSDEIHKLASYL
jgi:hypothetical protein